MFCFRPFFLVRGTEDFSSVLALLSCRGGAEAAAFPEDFLSPDRITFPGSGGLEGALAALVVNGADVKDPLLPNGLFGLFNEWPELGRAVRVELLDAVPVEVRDLPREDQAEGVGQACGEPFRCPGLVGVDGDRGLGALDKAALLDVLFLHGLFVVVELVDAAHRRAEV